MLKDMFQILLMQIEELREIRENYREIRESEEGYK